VDFYTRHGFAPFPDDPQRLYVTMATLRRSVLEPPRRGP
jgi:hypothetical protein